MNLRRLKYAGDYNDRLLAEIYDQAITDDADVALVKRLIGLTGPLRVLEPFGGTGRMYLPLLADGHLVTAIEIAQAMNDLALQKACRMGDDALSRLTIRTRDVLASEDDWGKDYDLVVLGGNALYELPEAEMQERCISLARTALVPGGRLYLDNNHWHTPPEAELGRKWIGLAGIASDGTTAREVSEVVSVDTARRVMKIRREWRQRSPDGSEKTRTYLGTKRPVDGYEVRGWLDKHGFEVLKEYGNRSGDPFGPESGRAIFWARRVR